MRPIIALLDLNALRHNLEVARSLSRNAKIAAMLKADAYGHGLLTCASALSAADAFGVIEIDAAVALREAGWTKPILLLEGFYEASELPIFEQHGLTPVVHTAEQIDMLESSGYRQTLDIFLKINTGMNRLGFPIERVAAAMRRLRSISCVKRITFMTHFACADTATGIAFQQERLSALDVNPDAWSMANSAALVAHRDSHHDVVRPGIMLYGSTPLENKSAQQIGLLPVMTLQSRIIGVQELKAGDIVGYGGTFTAPAPMRIGVVACGYGDGYPRHAGTGSPVSVNGERTWTVGRISMDKLAIDITHIPSARVCTEVELWGKHVSVDLVAEQAGTSGYQLLSAVATRVPRVPLPVGLQTNLQGDGS